MKKKFTFAFLPKFIFNLVLLAFLSLYQCSQIFAEDQKQVLPTEVTGTWTGGNYNVNDLPQQTTLILKKDGDGNLFTDKYEQNFKIDKLIKTADGGYVVYSKNFRDSQDKQYLLYVNGDLLEIYDRKLQNNSSLNEHQASTLSRNEFDFSTRYLRDMDPTKLKSKPSTEPVWNEIKASKLKSFMEEYVRSGLQQFGANSNNTVQYNAEELDLNDTLVHMGVHGFLKGSRILVGHKENRSSELLAINRVLVQTSKDGSGTAQYNILSSYGISSEHFPLAHFYFTINEGKPLVLMSQQTQGNELGMYYMYPSYDPKLQEAFAAIVNE
ncbi:MULTISPECIES: DUF4767 domain-containing protein [unclassified Streptococcus]|uniref:DUF4767 domain-containing protein n=1 Tax=unclassified Streptococcus TaxID=2608887 RepID=UPI0018CA58C1|nr:MULTISPECIES: DUF4767 domain-containing protein [unclassified Streptococcus]MBG9367273.1 DUF4767 domain-containing protein [Streptococcus sp. NLN64]MBJ6745008.1 DUF4767 domain-containing protein [Streptococcus sp. 121]